MWSALPIAVLLLAGETIRFDDHQRPQFTEQQVRSTAETTRAGFVNWIATHEGQLLVARFRGEEFEIVISEDEGEPSPGRAPQPGIATLLAAGDRTKVKRYELVLNPSIAAEYGRGPVLALGQPLTPTDVMATAWAAEMLHIDFYSCGIRLPHHSRGDFQERWQSVASELGFPLMKHDTEEEVDSDRRRAVIIIGKPAAHPR